MTAPVIETKRLTLRPLRMSDAGLLALYAGDERVARMTTRIPHPYPPGAAEAFIERHLESAAALDTVWVMDGTKSDASELIGLISTNRDRDFGEEVGYWVGPAFWGAGYAQEALAAIIANRFEEGVPSLHARVFQDNPASAHILTNAGFDYVGDGESHSVARGAMVDEWHYELRNAQ